MDNLRPDRKLVRWLPGLAAGLIAAYVVIAIPSIPLITAMLLMFVLGWASRGRPK
jgi:hypothetical protein